MLAKDAPWWAGERGSLPHAAGDNRPAYGNNNQPTGANASNYQPSRPAAAQPAQQQASPYKAPDMSAYAQPSGGYNASNVPRTAPEGARQNDLSGNVPSNQVWGQAYNQVAGQYGVPGATSFTMPGSFTSQGYNPTTGQYGQMTGGQSNDGNMAYNAIDSRPSPVTAYGTGVGGDQMSFQDTMSQREAFAGNLSQRLGQYSGGQLSGPVTFDPSQLMSQANDQLANGTFSNPFAQNAKPYDPSRNPVQPVYEDVNRQRFNPDVQRAMDNSNQYMQGDFQNPFGQQANVPTPSFGQQSYNPLAPQNYDMRTATFAAPPPSTAQQGEPMRLTPTVNAPQRQSPAPSAARPIEPPSQGTPYNPQVQVQGLPDVPSEEAPAPPTRVRYGYRAQANPVARRVAESESPAARKSPRRAPANMQMVPMNRRGSAARFGGLRQNGDNRR